MHDPVMDVLFDIFRRAGISVKKEAPVNFLTDPLEGRSTFRPADVLVHGCWMGRRQTCLCGLEWSFPTCGTKDWRFYCWTGSPKSSLNSSKVAKHEKTCSDNQHVFIPFTFDIFGFLAPEVVNLLKRVQGVMHNNIVSPRSFNVVFQRIEFVIQKGSAAQLVVRLLLIHVLSRIYKYII
ncbi:hypothetical protein QL285_049269 [Trifolium repens]|nr:hypothetical protein QL285_049269 [Trifolium repens]